MSRIWHVVVIGAVVVLPLVVSSACTTGATSTENPNIDQLGEFLYRYNGVDLSLVIGFRYAVQNVGEEWLMLEFAGSTPVASQAKIMRENVYIKTPDGTRLPLATQRNFAEGYGNLRPRLRRADVMRDPMDYFPANRKFCDLAFFAEPGMDVTFDEVTLNDQRVCEGRLFFLVPGGIQGGRWVLEIELEEESIQIPFRL
ncbi:MAG: hypothetical protein GY906_20735 [bacterium]|nr:hypothetical protein [bacterium]